MKTLVAKILGTKPLLFNKFNIEELSSTKKVRSGSTGNATEEWKRSVHEKGGQLYLPSNYFFSCICAGGVYTKQGRGTLKSKVAASLVIDTELALLDRHLPKNFLELEVSEMPSDSSEPVYLDIRSVKNPMTKGRNVRYRVACCTGWKTEITLSFDDTIISASDVKKIVKDAGTLVGIGDGRVLGYGRFLAEFD